MFKKIVLILCLWLGCCAQASAQAPLSGLWVDSRTGNDFWEINGTEEGFRFTAYGGSAADPRYLSRGVAIALEQGELHATVRDLPGRCCGQQGRLRIKMVSENQLEISGQFWVAGDPAGDRAATSVNFTLVREGAQPTGPVSPPPSIKYEPPLGALPSGPVSVSWSGSWRGDGWAQFFILQQGNILQMHWYYSQESPFYGLYTLAADGQSAQGTAVALVQAPGNTFYAHKLGLNKEPLSINVAVRRLAAPLEDGRWVSWDNAPSTSFSLQKISDDLPLAERADMLSWFGRYKPEALLRQTLEEALQSGRLVKRSYE